jgi:hypothetical protein
MALTLSVCLDGEAWLRGIYFDGASGEIQNNTVSVSRPAIDCAEGNGIEVRNRAQEGQPTTVLIKGNVVDQYQKTAIVVHGNVDATIDGNTIGLSTASQIVPNGIQVGPRATARIQKNQILGRFTGRMYPGAAIILYESGPGTVVDENLIDGNPEIGINVYADGATVTRNVVRDSDSHGVYDVGIVNQGQLNVFRNNIVTGFRNPYYGVDVTPPASRGQQIE